MAKVKIMGAFALILRTFFKCTLIILLCSQWAKNVHGETENPPLSNDQEVTIGCPIPDLRFVRAKTFLSTTESSLDTTQAPNEILSTSNVALDHHIEDARLTDEGGAHTSSLRQTRYTDYNPYAWNNENGDQVHLPGNSDAHLEESPNGNGKRVKRFSHRTKTKRRSKHHSHVHKHNERYIKHNDDAYNSVQALKKDYQHVDDNNGTNLEPIQPPINIDSNNTNNHHNGSADTLIFGMHENGFFYSQDGTMNHHGDNSFSHKYTDGDTLRIKFVHKSGKIIHKIALQRAQSTDIIVPNEHDNITDIDSENANKFNETSANRNVNENMKNVNESGMDAIVDDSEFVQTTNQNNNNKNNAKTLQLARVKRKSGKATGALSRPKGASDSGSKSTSRKKDVGYDEEGLYIPHGPEETDEESEEEEEEEDETIHFDEITEVHFPGEIGPIGDRRLCKIRCVKGKWVGPLCTSGEDGGHGHTKFQPLYKSCNVNRIPSHLILSYKNISVNVGWDVPHGHSLQARCKDLGLYKLLGESRVLCSNGLWAPRMPSCVPTTLLTNFSDDSPPSIRIKMGSGSGAFEPSGVLAVLPGSTIHLDCMYLKRKGTPEWTWTGWHRTYQTGWHITPDEKPSKFRLTIKDIQQQESGTYTCASPRGNTNSIQLIVTISNCQEPPAPIPPMILRLEGLKLGLRALYSCPIGYSIENIANATCLASGNWSSPPPVCKPIQCPSLYLEDPHLSMTELNTSVWGKAVFKCSWGYKLNGPPTLECESAGVWSGPVPRCRAIQCAQPILPINGRIDGTSAAAVHRKYAVGAFVTFSCNEGFSLVGEASIVCTETGFWSHPTPLCKSQCPYPGDPPNGLIAPLKFHYDPGDSLSVQCRPGFVEYGPPERPKCLPDGNWSGPVPQCRNYEDV